MYLHIHTIILVHTECVCAEYLACESATICILKFTYVLLHISLFFGHDCSSDVNNTYYNCVLDALNCAIVTSQIIVAMNLYDLWKN